MLSFRGRGGGGVLRGGSTLVCIECGGFTNKTVYFV